MFEFFLNLHDVSWRFVLLLLGGSSLFTILHGLRFVCRKKAFYIYQGYPVMLYKWYHDYEFTLKMLSERKFNFKRWLKFQGRFYGKINAIPFGHNETPLVHL